MFVRSRATYRFASAEDRKLGIGDAVLFMTGLTLVLVACRLLNCAAAIVFT